MADRSGTSPAATGEPKGKCAPSGKVAPAPPGPGKGAGKHGVPSAPVDMADGIPDCSSRRPAWKYALILLIFAIWLAVLVYIQVAGGQRP